MTAWRVPRVLIVDDSTVVRKVLTLTLRQLPAYLYATIEEAANGALALEMLRAAEYDLVLSDVRMPVMDGLDLVRRIREEPALRALPVVLITTLGTEEDRQRGLEAGATGYILKPIAPHHIIAALQEILALRDRR